MKGFTNPLAAIGEIVELVKLTQELVPTQLHNVKIDFFVEEIGLRFICDDRGFGDLQARIYDCTGDMVAYVEGRNHQGSQINIGHNTHNYSQEFLDNCFHMTRCRREFERTGDINYSRGYGYYRPRAIAAWQ